jgi:hypothetical protein
VVQFIAICDGPAGISGLQSFGSWMAGLMDSLVQNGLIWIDILIDIAIVIVDTSDSNSE